MWRIEGSCAIRFQVVIGMASNRWRTSCVLMSRTLSLMRRSLATTHAVAPGARRRCKSPGPRRRRRSRHRPANGPRSGWAHRNEPRWWCFGRPTRSTRRRSRLPSGPRQSCCSRSPCCPEPPANGGGNHRSPCCRCPRRRCSRGRSPCSGRLRRCCCRRRSPCCPRPRRRCWRSPLAVFGRPRRRSRTGARSSIPASSPGTVGVAAPHHPYPSVTRFGASTAEVWIGIAGSSTPPPPMVAPRTPAVTLFAGLPPITFGLIAFGS